MPKKTPAAPARYHHGNLKLELLERAATQLETEGSEAVSLNALAKQMGVSQAAPYRHFADRAALLAALAAQGFEDFGAVLQTAIAGRPASQHLALLGQAYLAFARARPHMYRLMFSSRIVATQPDHAELQQFANESFGVLLGALGGDRDERQAYRIAFLAWSGLHGLVLLEQEGFLPDPSSMAVDELFEALVRSLQLLGNDGGHPSR